MGNNVLALQRFVLFNSDSRLRWRQRPRECFHSVRRYSVLSLSLSLSLSLPLSLRSLLSVVRDLLSSRLTFHCAIISIHSRKG